MLEDKGVLRAMQFLARGAAALCEAGAGGATLLEGGERGTIALTPRALDRLEQAGLVSIAGEEIRLTEAGSRSLREAGARTAGFRPRQGETGTAIVDVAGGSQLVTINHAESPLALLWRRKTRDGSRFLDAREFRAGERLRSDYSFGQLMPRLGVNWSGFGAGAKNRGSANGIADLTDAALASRKRVEYAIRAVGPELAGVLIDVCCFLKGLEQVEAERSWPARSAKVLLKSALSALARHYEPPRAADIREMPVLHWGAEDYRPTIR